jgi:hypothetical protein
MLQQTPLLLRQPRLWKLPPLQQQLLLLWPLLLLAKLRHLKLQLRLLLLQLPQNRPWLLLMLRLRLLLLQLQTVLQLLKLLLRLRLLLLRCHLHR